MSVTAQAGILGFGPQAGKGVLPTTWYRHRATQIDLDVADPVNEGAPEVGGLAVPTFPYKSGPISAGGFVLQPRLMNTMGWLLYGLLGDCATSPAGVLTDNSVVNGQSLTTLGTKAVAGNPATPSLLRIKAATLTGTAIITIAGTDKADAVIYEVVEIASETEKFTKQVFKTVASVNVDKAASAGTLKIGAYSGAPYDHVFRLKPGNSGFVPYMGFRKMIPQVDEDYTTDLGQIFQDCKMIGGTFSLPNSAPINFRADVMGCGFSFDDDPDTWVWENDYEHWESIPIACATEGIVQVGNEEMPVVGMQVGFANVPQDVRQQRVFGNPFLEDITILQRRLTLDMTVKWKNPTLYRKIVTGAALGTEWSSHPFTGALHVKTVSSMNMPGESEPYSLSIDADEIMLSQANGIQLAGNESVLMRFTGVALEATNYALFTLRNKQAAYVWPA